MASFSAGFIDLCIFFAIGSATAAKNSKRRSRTGAVGAIFSRQAGIAAQFSDRVYRQQEKLIVRIGEYSIAGSVEPTGVEGST
jgi:hypothetical protein